MYQIIELKFTAPVERTRLSEKLNNAFHVAVVQSKSTSYAGTHGIMTKKNQWHVWSHNCWAKVHCILSCITLRTRSGPRGVPHQNNRLFSVGFTNNITWQYMATMYLIMHLRLFLVSTVRDSADHSGCILSLRQLHSTSHSKVSIPLSFEKSNYTMIQHTLVSFLKLFVRLL